MTTKNYYQKNKETIKKASNLRYRKNKKEILKRHKIAHKNRDTRELIIQRAKVRSSIKNIPFNITKKDILLPIKCPILGIKLKRNIGAINGQPDSYSIDRIIPELGYVVGNIRIISQKANMMKGDASLKELVSFAKYILNEEKRLKKVKKCVKI